jgi:hypothetical protein
VTTDPAEIPSGLSQTNVSVEVRNPSPENGLEVITEVTTIFGTITDPFAQKTTFKCAHDVAGEVEICVHATYLDGDGSPDGGTEEPSVGASYQYLGKPHVRLSDPLECSETRCTKVICPEEKNDCPVVSSLTVDPSPPTAVPEGGTATITVVAEDPDDGPEALVTTLSALHGTITDPNAHEATFACDPDVGGIIEICVVASDGDSSCGEVKLCTTVLCPGEPLENTCPIIEAFTANPMTIDSGETTTEVRVDALDPDVSPEPLRTEIRSDTGVLGDRFAGETTFTCGEPGDVELCVDATDGAPDCDQSRCITVQCPSTIPPNLCPMLFVINAVPRNIAPGETTTLIQTRAQDTDALPLPLVLTLRALWGTLENVENIQEPLNVVAQNATYICDRPGQVEICVDATDGACQKTQCDIVTCPADIPPP